MAQTTVKRKGQRPKVRVGVWMAGSRIETKGFKDVSVCEARDATLSSRLTFHRN